jgi:hypothetical protein
VVAGIALALLVLPFALAGYQLLLGMSSKNHASAIEALARVVLIALAVGLSYFVLSELINIENALAQFLFTHITVSTYDAMPSANWQNCIHQFVINIFNLNVYTNLQLSQQLTTAEYAQDVTGSTLLLIENLPNYILTLLSVILTIQLILRLVLLNFHIIMSPLVIICGALPGQIGPNAARHWAQGFLALLAVQILQLLVLLLGSSLINLPTALMTSGWAGTLFTELLRFVVMLITLNMPRLFNVSATTMIANVSSSIGGAMSSVTLIIRGL